MDCVKDIEFRKPNFNDINEIELFKQEFIDTNGSMDGTGKLRNLNAEE